MFKRFNLRSAGRVGVVWSDGDHRSRSDGWRTTGGKTRIPGDATSVWILFYFILR